MLRNPNYVSDEAFYSLYPKGYATVVRSDIRLRKIDDMIQDAQSAEDSAKVLRKAIDRRL